MHWFVNWKTPSLIDDDALPDGCQGFGETCCYHLQDSPRKNEGSKLLREVGKYIAVHMVSYPKISESLQNLCEKPKPCRLLWHLASRPLHAELIITAYFQKTRAQGSSSWPNTRLKVHKLFQKSRSHIKILGFKRVTRSKFHDEDRYIFGATATLCTPALGTILCLPVNGRMISRRRVSLNKQPTAASPPLSRLLLLPLNQIKMKLWRRAGPFKLS